MKKLVIGVIFGSAALISLVSFCYMAILAVRLLIKNDNWSLDAIAWGRGKINPEAKLIRIRMQNLLYINLASILISVIAILIIDDVM